MMMANSYGNLTIQTKYHCFSATEDLIISEKELQLMLIVIC